MASFSQRKGLKPLTNPLQRKQVDTPLRNLLWSAIFDLTIGLWSEDSGYGFPSYNAEQARLLINAIWCFHFKHPSDSLPQWPRAISEMRRQFFECQWNEVYDLLEFVAKNSNIDTPFSDYCNKFLEQENSAYRFVGQEIVDFVCGAVIMEI
jgi:hypothetical protein